MSNLGYPLDVAAPIEASSSVRAVPAAATNSATPAISTAHEEAVPSTAEVAFSTVVAGGTIDLRHESNADVAAVAEMPQDSTEKYEATVAYANASLFSLAVRCVSSDGFAEKCDDKIIEQSLLWAWGIVAEGGTSVDGDGSLKDPSLSPARSVCTAFGLSVGSAEGVRLMATQIASMEDATVMAQDLVRTFSRCSVKSAPADDEHWRKLALQRLVGGEMLWKLLLAVTGRASLCEPNDPMLSGASAPKLLPFEYDARTRAALRLVARWCEVPWRQVANLEYTLAHLEVSMEGKLTKASAISSAEVGALPAISSTVADPAPSQSNSTSGRAGGFLSKGRKSADLASTSDANLREQQTSPNSKWTWKRMAKVGGAAVGGGVLLAVTGGLAAPALAAGIAGAGAAAGGGIAAVAGTVAGVASSGAIMGTAFGAAGASVVAAKTARLTAGLSVFDIKAIESDDDGPSRLAIVVCVSGFLTPAGGEDDFVEPWRVLANREHMSDGAPHDADVVAVQWEPKQLSDLGRGLWDVTTQSVASAGASQVIKQTIFASVAAAVALPATLLSATAAIDNRWSLGISRADAAGRALADWLLARPLGARPATLIGASLGGRVVLKALLALAEEPDGRGLGLVERAVVLGAPIAPSHAEWTAAAHVCGHEVVNCYCENDFTLSVLFRTVDMASQLVRPVAGLAPIPSAVASTEKFRSVNVSEVVGGSHVAYQAKGKCDECLYLCGLV